MHRLHLRPDAVRLPFDANRPPLLRFDVEWQTNGRRIVTTALDAGWLSRTISKWMTNYIMAWRYQFSSAV